MTRLAAMMFVVWTLCIEAVMLPAGNIRFVKLVATKGLRRTRQGAFTMCWLLLLNACHGADIATLKTIPPLPKITPWYEPGAPTWDRCDAAWLTEVCRICGTVCLRIEGATDAHALRVASVAKVLKVPVSVNCSPTLDDAYLARLKADCGRIKLALSGSTVAQVLVDYEQTRFYQPSPRLQEISDTLRAAFPAATQQWYQCDQVEFLHGWEKSSYGAEYLCPPVPSSFTMYALEKFDLMLEKWRQNAAAAKVRHQDLTAIVAIGWGYGWQWGKSNNITWYEEVLKPTGPRGLDLYILGAHLYDKWSLPPINPDNSGIRCVCLYPAPGDTRFPDWERNFIQLACGGTRTDPPAKYKCEAGNPDLDGDGDVDHDDFAILQAARTAPGVIQPPATQPEVPPVTTQPAPGDRVLTTLDSWQAAVSNAQPGDTIWFHGGDYKQASGGQNYEACLSINVSGEPGKPITIRNVPGERPVFYGTGKTYAIVVGYIKYDGTKFGVHDVVLDGLNATQAPWDGIEVAKSNGVAIRNCSAYANNFNSPNGYKAGFNLEGSINVTIDRCRAYDNGCGIQIGAEQAGVAEPKSVTGIVVKDCFVYGNSRAGNMGNAEGIELWFCDGAIVSGNILWDNPDSNINGQGNTRCRYIGNICLNSWQPGGNNEGFKACVRGGGGNVVSGNVFAGNANCGFDAAAGVGDLLVNNTLYSNGSWGILAEGRESMLFNNLVAGNSTKNATDIPAYEKNDYIEMDALGWSLICDWNRFGKSPTPYTRPSPAIPFPANSSIGVVPLAGYPMARTDPRQIIHPLQAFGTDDIAAARAKIMAAYRPATAIPGASVAQIQTLANSNIPTVKSALDAAILAAGASNEHQQKQAKSRYILLKSQLSSYDLGGVLDTGVIGAVE